MEKDVKKKGQFSNFFITLQLDLKKKLKPKENIMKKTIILGNMAVFDCDFLHDDIEKVAQANLLATIVDGEEVFKAY